MSTLYTHEQHPHIEERKTQAPPKVADQLPTQNAAARVNSWLAVRITDGVGTMWCAYAFAALALISLPAAIATHSLIIIVAWVAQTFLQLVLLSIIIVGQNISQAAADKRAEATYKDADAVLHEAIQIQRHLEAQDAAIERILTLVGGGSAGRSAPGDGAGAPDPAG
jgi:hypothetical protein